MKQTRTYLIDGVSHEATIAETKKDPKRISFPEDIVGKNRPCSCGSGKKFKLCCMKKGGK